MGNFGTGSILKGKSRYGDVCLAPLGATDARSDKRSCSEYSTSYTTIKFIVLDMTYTFSKVASH